MDRSVVNHVRMLLLTDRLRRGVGIDGVHAEMICCAFTVTGIGSLSESTLR